MPFDSLENPFAKPPAKPRSKDNAKLVGLILGPEHEAAMREILGSPPPDDEDPFAIPPTEDHEFTGREQLEITYHLTEQYEKEVRSLRTRGLLEINKESGVEFIRGIDGLEYPLPSIETIADRLSKQKERLEIKAEQGFTKLILVPFAVSLDRQIEGLNKTLLDHKKKHPDFDLDASEPVYHWNGYNGADMNGDLVYGVKEFSQDPAKHQGLTKKQIIEAQRNASDSLAGWRIELLQADRKTRGIRKIPRAGDGKTDGKIHPRPEIEAGNSPNKYLANQLPDESGLTPEDWISAFIYHLQETGKPLDDHQDGEDSLAYLTGTWFKSSGNVPRACWLANFRQAILHWFEPVAVRPDIGVRPVVRI